MAPVLAKLLEITAVDRGIETLLSAFILRRYCFSVGDDAQSMDLSVADGESLSHVGGLLQLIDEGDGVVLIGNAGARVA